MAPLTSAISLVGNNVATRNVCIPQGPYALIEYFEKARWGPSAPAERCLNGRAGP